MANKDDRLRCRLYLITPPDVYGDKLSPFADALAAALDGGDVACVQLRLKDVDDAVILDVADRLRPICHDHDVALIMNDRADLAAKADCDGVHVGQTDTPYGEARALLGDDASSVSPVMRQPISRWRLGKLALTMLPLAHFLTAQPNNENLPPIRKFCRNGRTQWWSPASQSAALRLKIVVPSSKPALILSLSPPVSGPYPDGPGAAVKAFNDIFDEVAVSSKELAQLLRLRAFRQGLPLNCDPAQGTTLFAWPVSPGVKAGKIVPDNDVAGPPDMLIKIVRRFNDIRHLVDQSHGSPRRYSLQSASTLIG